MKIVSTICSYQIIRMTSMDMHQIYMCICLVVNIFIDYLSKAWTITVPFHGTIEHWPSRHKLLIICMFCYLCWCTSPHADWHVAKNTEITSFATLHTTKKPFIGSSILSWPSKNTTNVPISLVHLSNSYHNFCHKN